MKTRPSAKAPVKALIFRRAKALRFLQKAPVPTFCGDGEEGAGVCQAAAVQGALGGTILPILDGLYPSFTESLIMLCHEDFLFSFLSYRA